MQHALRLFATLAILLTLSAPAPAVDTLVSGSWDFAFQRAAVTGSNDAPDSFWARQRIQTVMEFIVSESLKGVLAFEIGEANWGNVGETTAAGHGFSLGSRGVNVGLWNAYVDWFVADTGLKLRVGVQDVILPAAVAGSPVLDETMPGIMLSYPFNEMLGVTLLWARLWDGTVGGFSNVGGQKIMKDDETDLFGLILPVAADDFSVTLYGVYMDAGKNSEIGFEAPTGSRIPADFEESSNGYGSLNAWWLGGAVELAALDPLIVKFDAIIGGASTDGREPAGSGPRENKLDTRGFFIAAAADYTLDSFTPGVFGFYGSGINSKGKGFMPVIAPCFSPTSFATDGAFGINTAAMLTASGVGLWGLGVQLADISFAGNLSHTLRFVYYNGTNDQERVGAAFLADGLLLLGRKDRAWEVNLDSTYNIFEENLVAALEIGYIGLHLEEYANSGSRGGLNGIWKAALALQYNF